MSSPTEGEVRVSSREKDLYVSVVLKFFDMGLSPYEQAAYLWLKRRSGKHSTVWESVPRMAKSAGMSERRFHTALQQLQALGMLEAHTRSGQTTEYVLTDQSEWANPATLAPRAGVSAPTPAPRATPPAPHAEVPLHDMQGTPAPRADKVTTTKKQPRRNNQEIQAHEIKPAKPAKKFDPLEVELPDFVDPQAWADFVGHRSEIRKPLTQRAARLILADLEKHPADANEMLATSVKRGWTGVFPLDKPRNALARRGNGTPEERAAESATNLLAHLERRKAS